MDNTSARRLRDHVCTRFTESLIMRDIHLYAARCVTGTPTRDPVDNPVCHLLTQRVSKYPLH